MKETTKDTENRAEELQDTDLDQANGGISLNFEEIKVTKQGPKGPGDSGNKLVGDDVGA